MWAASGGRVEAARLLLDAGAEKDLKDSGGGTALTAAAMNGHVEVALLLLDAGADQAQGWSPASKTAPRDEANA
eukprot:g9298.t1